MGAARAAIHPPAESIEFDPMMGRLEVIEPGIAMFHGFANVAFAYGGGEMLAIDTSSAQMGALAVKAIREVTLRAVRLPHLYAWSRRSRLRYRGVHQ